MASYDAEVPKLRAISQDNSASIQKLNEELRKLKAGIQREASRKAGSPAVKSDTHEPKT
jgi:hypothetical protein